MRVIGQCSGVDFQGIEHLASITEEPEKFDTSTLSNKQRLAFTFLTVAFRKGISWNLVRGTVREVLFWGENGDTVKRITIKFFRNGAKRRDVEEFGRLWFKERQYV